MYTFCFQNFFLVNNLHTSWHPDIISLFKNLIFHKEFKKEHSDFFSQNFYL